MGRNLKIAVAAILALAIASCASEGDQASNPTPTPNSAQTQPPSAIQSFKNPVVPAKQAPSVASTTPNLIQSTNATERVIVVSKGRSDPVWTNFLADVCQYVEHKHDAYIWQIGSGVTSPTSC
jgi:PBP1b-binding outer membrane lipoprotein LpoB